MKEWFTKQLKKLIKKKLKALSWAFCGTTIRNPKYPDHPKSLLFVCKGNVCRSPFAEYLIRKMAAISTGHKPISYSAGLEVSRSMPPPKEAIMAAETFGIQLNGHRSRRLSHKMVESFDMVITMEVRQFRVMQKAFPKHRDKIFLLPLFDSMGRRKLKRCARYNIRDPYGENLAAFQDCFRRIESGVGGMFEEMSGVETPR